MSDLQARFERFHADHPSVYRKLVNLAWQWKESGRTHCGIGMLWETTRFHTMLGSQDEAFRLNNDYRSRYARLIMAQEPELAGLFETRALRADS